MDGRFARGIKLPVFFQRTPHALQSVLGPDGPARHRGVSVREQCTQRISWRRGVVVAMADAGWWGRRQGDGGAGGEQIGEKDNIFRFFFNVTACDDNEKIGEGYALYFLECTSAHGQLLYYTSCLMGGLPGWNHATPKNVVEACLIFRFTLV